MTGRFGDCLSRQPKISTTQSKWYILVGADNADILRTTTEILNFVKDFFNFQPKSRNAQLAQLELISWGVESGKLETKHLFTACKEYLDRNKTRLYTFGDLSRYIHALDQTLLSEFIGYQLKSLSEENEVSYRNIAAYRRLTICRHKAHSRELQKSMRSR